MLHLRGEDSEGVEFGSLEELWSSELGPAGADAGTLSSKRAAWYDTGLRYWKGADATVDGVLGGFGHITEIDIRSALQCSPVLIPQPFITGSHSAAAALSPCDIPTGQGTTYPASPQWFRRIPKAPPWPWVRPGSRLR